MTVRDLVKELESCSLDKEVFLIASVLEENEDAVKFLLKQINQIVENGEFVGIQ